MQAVLDLLGRDDTADDTLGELLCELAAMLEHRMTAPETVAAYEDAIQRAPWLTAERERLRQQQAAVRQSLRALAVCQRCAGGSNASRQQLVQQMQDVAELYIEYDMAEQNFLQTAFPGPDWAN